MRSRSWNLGQIRGVSVLVDASALFLVLIPGAYSYDSYRQYFSGQDLFLLVLVIVVGYLISIVLHEAGHVVAGRIVGIRSNAVVLHGFGGLAFLDEIPDTPMKQAFVSAAGPLVNLMIWLFLEPLATDQLNSMTSLGTTGVVWIGVLAVAGGNQFFAIFNLVPAPPLDGGSVMEAFLWRATGDRAEAYRQSGTVGLGAIGVAAVLALAGVGPFTLFSVFFLALFCGQYCMLRRQGVGMAMLGSTNSGPAPKKPRTEPRQAQSDQELEHLRTRAISQAREFGDREATSAHVLLAVSQARYSPVGLMLATFGVTYSDLWDLARQNASMVLNMTPPEESREVKTLFRRAARSGHGAAGTFMEFESGSPAARLLADAGIDLAQAQQELRPTLL